MTLPRHGFGFGPYLVDPVRRLVWYQQMPLPVTGKAFEILIYLLEHRDRVVEKEELLKAVWPDTFVQENNLVRHVSTLRRALGQRPDQHDCIVTVQGRGYQFVGQVVELDELPPNLPTSGPSTEELLLARNVDEAVAPGPAPRTGENGSAQPARGDAGRTATSVVTPDQPRRPSWRASVILGILTACVSAMLGLSFAGRRSLEASTSPRIVRQVTYGPSSHLGPTWSPDGQAIAYASDRGGNFDIWVQRFDGSEPIQLTTSSFEDWQPAWSPDGQWLAYRSEQNGGGLFVVSLNGGMIRQISTFGYQPRWSPDGTRILFSNSMVSRRPRPQLFVVGRDGAALHQVRADLTGAFSASTAAWTADGRISVWGLQRNHWALIAGSADATDATSFGLADELAHQLNELELQPIRFTWAPGGTTLVFDGVMDGGHSLWRVAVDANRARLTTPLERLTTGADGDQDPALSPEGDRLAYSAMSERTRIWAFALNGDGRIADAGVPVTLGGSGEYDAAVSTDAKNLIYRTIRDGRQEVWERSLQDGRERRLISSDEALRSSPRWSPDGTRIAYQLNKRRAQSDGLLVVFALNDMREQVLTPPGALSLIPDDWSRDGHVILGPCVAGSSSTSGACVATAMTPASVRLIASDPDRNFRSLRFSPDQRWLSAVAFPRTAGGGTSAIVAIPANGGPIVPITDGLFYDQKPVWGSDSRTLYFVSNRDGFFNVWGRHFDAQAGRVLGEPFRVTSLASPRQMIAPDLDRAEIAVAAAHLYVPITESTGQVSILQNLDR